MNPAYAAVLGLRLEQVGQLWAAFSPASGDTTLLNDEGAAILEILGSRPLTHVQVCDEVAVDTGQTFAEIAAAVEPVWLRLIESGLVQQAALESSTAAVAIP